MRISTKRATYHSEMGRLGDFFSMTRYERLGAFAVLLALAVAVAFSYCSRIQRETAPAGSKPSEEVMRELMDTVSAQPLTASPKKKGATGRGGKKKTEKKKRNKKDGASAKAVSDRSDKGGMEEVPSF